uniref:Uncharacterized protein n=1 Tax=Schistosoma haematobium TaxID=6185 RepID=A0A095AMT6_SCHHA
MDQRHTARLGNISRSGQFIPGSRYYLGDNITSERFKRRQSDSGAWDSRSEIHNHHVHNAFRSRTYSETRRLNEYSDNSMSTRYHNQSNQQPYYKTTASHNISNHSPTHTHISRWSSMQTTGTQGLWRGTSGGRYATTLTRQHIKKHHDPIEMPSAGASRVDLLSVDNRQGSLPHLAAYSIHNTGGISEREQKLQNELLNTQRELQHLKRSRSLTGDQNLTHSTTLKQTLKSGSSQYLNDGFWTTYSLKKNEGQPCGARIAGSRLSPIITNRQSNEFMMKSTEPSSPIVDYLLYDAPAWMRQSKIKNHKVISSVNSSSTISSNIITTTAAAAAARTPVVTTISPSSNITHIVNDTKPNTDNITIIHKENVKNMNSGSRITIQSDLSNNNNNDHFIRSSSPRSNGSFRFNSLRNIDVNRVILKSKGNQLSIDYVIVTMRDNLEMNPKLNPPTYMQKLDDVLVENEMNTEPFKTIKKSNKFNLNKNPDHDEDWTVHDGSRRFTPILSSPISMKTPPPSQFQSQSQLRPLSPPLPPLPPTTTTTIPLIEKINQLTTINKFNEIIQPNYKENLFTEQKSIWNKTNKTLTQFNEQLPNYSNKFNHQRIIHSTPCSPTIERNILIKPIHNHEDDDVILRNHKKSSIGLPPRPLRSPIIRLNGRSMSPIHPRISPLPSCTNNEVTKIKQIDPITGEIQYITSRTRSYTDLNTNQLITEIEENIQGEGDTEVRVVRRKTRKIVKDSRIRQSTEQTQTDQIQPQRTSSQMNISGPSTMTKTAWLSETNLRNSSTCKQPPMYSTYSAHKENMRRMQEQRRTTEDWQASNRQLHDSRSVGSRAVLEEMETITLQPIGRGVHDLEPPTGSIARSVRATTPSGVISYITRV